MTYHPYYITGEERASRWLVTCDHATNTVPSFVGDGTLGLSAVDMSRHIAFDPGAAGVSLALAEALGAPCITSNFSRLVIDPNRGEDDPTLVMKLYDGTIIPANRHIDETELNLRLNRCYRPYHTALAELAARQDDTIIVAVHSFTRQLRGQHPRPWHVGVLFAADTRLTDPLIAQLEAEPDICVGANEPYSGHLPGDAIARHAIAFQRPNALLELRNDLIERPEDQGAWANRLAPMLEAAAERAGL
ncbi:N-formylglutamate amidohydrolase [Roseovarius phycicola]|uniref:N-formylglutamate amidohydrolase n=1 Tax=Roseovarius phycicola TaxID=3080976 RepID=A0ABZ2HGY2_9RHOB